jgi:hypothetical protein
MRGMTPGMRPMIGGWHSSKPRPELRIVGCGRMRTRSRPGRDAREHACFDPPVNTHLAALCYLCVTSRTLLERCRVVNNCIIRIYISCVFRKYLSNGEWSGSETRGCSPRPNFDDHWRRMLADQEWYSTFCVNEAKMRNESR